MAQYRPSSLNGAIIGAEIQLDWLIIGQFYVEYGEIRGIGYNISRNLGYENDLWRLFSFNNPKSNGYLLFIICLI
jgi:hypothetical protein